MTKKRRKKYGTMRCHTCGRTITYKIYPKYVIRNGADPNRLIAIRKHYARFHKAKWRAAILRGVRKRKARAIRKRRLRK